MGVIRSAPHVQRFNDNIKEVNRLGAIHDAIAAPRTDRGRKREVEVLHKSAIVLLCACWEAFVEDLATAAVAELLDRTNDPAVVPAGLQARICLALKETKNERKPWDLAGQGWRTLVTMNCKQVVEKLHSPKREGIDTLFAHTIGLQDVSESWKWSAVSAARARDRLERLLDLRGAIAHRVDAGATVDRKRVQDESHLIHRLAVCTHNRVHQHLRTLTGGEIWPRFRYGSAGRSEFPAWWGKGYPWEPPNRKVPSATQA